MIDPRPRFPTQTEMFEIIEVVVQRFILIIFVAGVVVVAEGCGQPASSINGKTGEVSVAGTHETSGAALPEPGLLGVDFGAIWGETVLVRVPEPGRYLADLDFSQSKFQTREIYTSHKIHGHSSFEFKGDGTAEACLAAKHKHHHSESKYVPGSRGKGIAEDRTDMWVIGLRGKWTKVGKEFAVTLDHALRGSCDFGDSARAKEAAVELRCVLASPGEKLPVDTLLCRSVSAEGIPGDVALASGDTLVEGPYNLRGGRRDGGRWFVGGRAPGLKVISRDDRHSDAPEVSFGAAEVRFRAGDFTETAAARARCLERERRNADIHPVLSR